MKIIEPSVELLWITPKSEKMIEQAGRTCYRSEDRITETSAGEFAKKMNEFGHLAMIEHAVASFRIVTDRGCCYDDQTKVLTKKGWKYFKDTDDDDVYYTLDDNNQVTYSKCNKFIKKHYTGKLDHYQSKQIDLLVTPNHNMWVFDYDKRSVDTRIWDFIKSEDMNNRRYVFMKSAIPISRDTPELFTVPGVTLPKGFYNKHYPELNLNSKLLFELLGWWITDGHIEFSTNGSGNKLSISQTKTNGVNRISAILNELELEYRVHRHDFFISSPQLLYWISSNFLIDNRTNRTFDYYIPKWFFDKLSPDVLRSFLRGVIGGNGSKFTGGNGYQVYTSSYQFCEDLVELALHTGLSANIRTIEPRDRVWLDGRVSHCKVTYVVSIIPKRQHLFDKKFAIKEKVDYNGFVYCVELPVHHRLYVMRNGKPCWCGNTHEIVRHRLASYAQESTRYCNYSADKFGNEISVIVPPDLNPDQYDAWEAACLMAERKYLEMLKLKCSPQIARSVLPTCTKTEIVMMANFREWQHFIKLRGSSKAHPQIRPIAHEIHRVLAIHAPSIFGE